MLFNPFLQMMEIQSKNMSMMTSVMQMAVQLHRTRMDCVRQMMFMPQSAMGRIVVPTASAAFIRRADMEMFRHNAASMRIETDFDAMAIQAAETEGMTMVAPVVGKKRMVTLTQVEYDAPCNADAEVVAPAGEEVAAIESAKSISKWFSKKAVASEQDTVPAKETRRVYSGFGQSPDAPSAKAVLERYKGAKEAASA